MSSDEGIVDNRPVSGSAKISKEELATLPALSFSGRIWVVDTPAKCATALATLSKCKTVGFDTETRPSFTRGERHRVALIQISSDSECFLFRLNCLGGIPEELKLFLESPNVIKIGLSLRDDFNAVNRVCELHPAGFIDLQVMAPQYGIGELSLSKIYGIVFGQRISKSQRLTNWEADELNESQQHYAAIDAWACLNLWKKLDTEGFDAKSSRWWKEKEETDEP